LKAVTGKALARIAEAKGWKLARINGSHHIYTQPGRDERLVIPMHGNKTLKIGLQRKLMKMIPVEAEEL
jgi:predicted RNA binding protein YcfA (HicA-like mRNA interferase family)